MRSVTASTRVALAAVSGVAAVAAMGGVAGASTLTARLHSARTRSLTAEYKGTYHFEDHYNSSGQVLNVVESYTWDETVTDVVNDSNGDLVRRTVSLAAGGHLHQDDGKATTVDCSIQQLKVPSSTKPTIFIQTDTHTARVTGVGASVALPDLVGDQLVETGMNCPRSQGALASDNYKAGTVGAVFPGNGDAKTQRFINAFSVVVQNTPLAKLPVMVPVSVDQSGSVPGESGTRSIHGEASVGGRAGAIPPSSPDTPPNVRSAALDALRRTVPQAFAPCLMTTSGTVIFLGLPGPLGPIVGSTMVTVAGPVCARLVASLHSLVLIYNDPPVARDRTVARVQRRAPPRLPFTPCPSSKATRRICNRLHRAATALVGSVTDTASVEAALATTVGRESAAAGAGDKTALKRQRKAALALLPRLRAALRSERTAGRALATVLQSAHARANLSSTQVGGAVSFILTALGRAGANVGQVQAAAGKALRPRPVDALSLLAR